MNFTADPIRARSIAGAAEHKAKAPQYYLMDRGRYLHNSGDHLQDGRRYAWTGSIDQARAIRRASSAAAGCRTVNVRSIVPTPMQTEEA